MRLQAAILKAQRGLMFESLRRSAWEFQACPLEFILPRELHATDQPANRVFIL